MGGPVTRIERIDGRGLRNDHTTRPHDYGAERTRAASLGFFGERDGTPKMCGIVKRVCHRQAATSR